MAIYDLGTASLSASGEVTGVGTTWKAPLTLIRVGATIVFKTEPVQIYTISEIISDTQINVYNPNSETVPAGTGYAILAHDGITVQGLAQDVAETLRFYQSRETEVATAVDVFKDFDQEKFSNDVNQVNTKYGEIVNIGSQVSADAAQVTADKDAAAASAASASSDKDAAAASAQQAADYAASLNTENLLRKDLALSDLTDKALARNNLDVYSKAESQAVFSGYDGFNKLGRVLNISALRTVNPPSAGITIYVSSAYSDSEAKEHKGGGFFHSVSRVGQVNDYGIVVFPTAEGEFCWKRVDHSSYNAEFWGVVADGSTDNATAISRAMDYARRNRVVINFPAGSIHTSEAVPVFSNCGIKGSGARVESTVFYKTTNNPYSIFGTISVDAMCVMVPQARWNVPDYSMDSYNVHGSIEGCHFRRLGLNSENVATIRPQYGLFMGKAGSPVIQDSSFEGAYIGIKAYNAFSGVIARTSIAQFDGYGYAGLDISAYENGTLYLSGTSMDLRNIGVRGYQLGFSVGRLQYSTMTNCHAEQISPLLVTPNERAWAFEFINPYGITMQGCATEFVKGGQINVRGFTDASFGSNLSVFGYVAIDQQSPTVSTPYYQVDGGGNTVNVIFQGCELGVASLTNLTSPVVSSSGTKVVYIANSNAAPPYPTAGAQVVALA